MQNVIIFGASGHGSVVLDCIEREGKYKIAGFVDSFKEKGKKINGYAVLGSEFDLPHLVKEHKIHGGIIAIGDNWTRHIVVNRISKIFPDFEYISAVHPSAQIGSDVLIGGGSVVMPGVIINANSVIGNHCILNTRSSLDHDGFMNNYSSIAPNVCVGGNFNLGKGSAICLGTNIIENITVGPHSVVGAGSLVVASIESHVLAYGSPAKVVRERIASEAYLAGSKNPAPVIPLLASEM